MTGNKKIIGSLIVVLLFIITAFNCIPKTTSAIEKTNELQNPVVGLNLGNLAPEISMADPSGKKINLSSLRGQVVLLDFWASWCGPCRYENPTLVKAYELYNDKKFTNGKGFTIYSVSLDGNPAAWKMAIEKDKLSWTYHVSDLQGWANEAAGVYGVGSIPANFLLNEKGVIINKNLRGQDLLDALEKLRKK